MVLLFKILKPSCLNKYLKVNVKCFYLFQFTQPILTNSFVFILFQRKIRFTRKRTRWIVFLFLCLSFCLLKFAFTENTTLTFQIDLRFFSNLIILKMLVYCSVKKFCLKNKWTSLKLFFYQNQIKLLLRYQIFIKWVKKIQDLFKSHLKRIKFNVNTVYLYLFYTHIMLPRMLPCDVYSGVVEIFGPLWHQNFTLMGSAMSNDFSTSILS